MHNRFAVGPIVGISIGNELQVRWCRDPHTAEPDRQTGQSVETLTKHLPPVEYAIAKVEGFRDVTQADIAERYGVAPGSISNRYGEIRAALELTPGDPRYCSCN